MKLNAEAPIFVPQYMHLAAPAQGWDDESIYFEELTEGELEELEATDEWVSTLAHLEELERDHLVELALRLASPAQLDAVEKRAGAGKKAGHRARHFRTRGQKAAAKK